MDFIFHSRPHSCVEGSQDRQSGQEQEAEISGIMLTPGLLSRSLPGWCSACFPAQLRPTCLGMALSLVIR